MHIPNLPELIIIALIVLVLFGRGKVASMGGEIGSAIREFKRGLNGENTPATAEKPVIEEENKKTV